MRKPSSRFDLPDLGPGSGLTGQCCGASESRNPCREYVPGVGPFYGDRFVCQFNPGSRTGTLP